MAFLLDVSGSLDTDDREVLEPPGVNWFIFHCLHPDFMKGHMRWNRVITYLLWKLTCMDLPRIWPCCATWCWARHPPHPLLAPSCCPLSFLCRMCTLMDSAHQLKLDEGKSQAFTLLRGVVPLSSFLPRHMECVLGKIGSLKHSFLTPQCLIDRFQIPTSYCSVPVSPARCAGALVEVSIFSMAPGRPPVVPKIQYNLVRDIWCRRDLPCDLWPHSCTFLSSSVLYCFRAHRPLQQEVAFEKNAGSAKWLSLYFLKHTIW